MWGRHVHTVPYAAGIQLYCMVDWCVGVGDQEERGLLAAIDGGTIFLQGLEVGACVYI